MDRETKQRLIKIGLVILALIIIRDFLQFGMGGLWGKLIHVLILVFAGIPAIMCHEVAHGYVSHLLGDPLPKAMGRLTFNPLKHLDPIGTLMVLIFKIGWAKPVMIDPRYYKDRRTGELLVALAGPGANFSLAFIAALLLVLLNPTAQSLIGNYLVIFFTINVALGVFNLIPLPPLDGSKVLYFFLPDRLRYKIAAWERYSAFIFIAFILLSDWIFFAGSGGFGYMLMKIIQPVQIMILRLAELIAG